MRNQSSYLQPELRRTWSLHLGPRDLPEHLLCQASRDGPSQALGTGSERKTPLFAEPSSPSCAQLSPHSHQLRPTERLGTSKPLRPGGANADRRRWDGQAGGRGTRGFEVPARPQAVALWWVTPSQLGGGPPWDRNAQVRDPRTARPAPLVLEMQQSSPSRGPPRGEGPA